MDASQSALDSLRTVKFREALKGCHRDDVDEYLEKAAVEAEGLQEQLRQSGERLRQAAERISQLETQLEAAAEQPAAPPRGEAPVVADDTLQRTLLLAQKFVDETKADSEAQAARVVAEAEAKAPEATEPAQSRASLVAAEPGPGARGARGAAKAEAKAREGTESAQSRASLIAAESEQRLREEIARLEESRIRLTGQVESMSTHLESERNRLRTALGDILRWVDQNVQPSPG